MKWRENFFQALFFPINTPKYETLQSAWARIDRMIYRNMICFALFISFALFLRVWNFGIIIITAFYRLIKRDLEAGSRNKNVRARVRPYLFLFYGEMC